MIRITARTVALGLALAVILAVAGCAPKARVVGTWEAPVTSGRAGTLSTLTLASDGGFRYGGKNAHGMAVAFTGTYSVGSTAGRPTMTLVYNDFPSRPVTWYYTVTPTTLTVSTELQNLTSGAALQFVRQK